MKFFESNDSDKAKRILIYAVIENYILFGLDEEAIKDVINTYNNKKADNSALMDDQNSFSILNITVDKFIDDYYKYVAKYSGRSSSFNQFEAERKIKPFFDVYLTKI